jgi:predicted dithiol-disulfide oxidoreductase (DUF899 family)
MVMIMAEPRHSVRFPNESDEYRDARNELLESEMGLRRHIESVAEQRRKLPIGGEVPDNYVFADANGDVRMSELFADGKETLVLYNYMYGPSMPEPCVSCTSILDALDGETPHILQRVNFNVVAKSPIERIQAVARDRGWRNLRLLSSAANTYNRDYRGENAAGAQMPMLNVFTRRDGRIHHTYGTELLFAPSEPGQDGRHVDTIWPLWNMFDFTPEGRGTNWYPKLRY